MRVRKILHLFLFTVVALVSWRILAAWFRPLEIQPPQGQQNVEEEVPLSIARPGSPQVGKRYADIIADKDLFVPSRSRAAVAVQAATAVPPPSHLKLVGVILSHGKEEAFFSDASQGGKVLRAKAGETLGSYKVVGISASQATLSLGQEGNEVSLPLLILDSNSAVQAQRMLPAQMRKGAGQQARLGAQPSPVPGRPGAMTPGSGAEAPPAEARAIRQNIQQLQQRLRQIRRQAAGNEAEEEDDEEDEEEGEEDEEEDEE